MSDVVEKALAPVTAPAPSAPVVRIKLALDKWEREQARQLRREVFCAEQGVFQDDDTDAIDAIAMPIVAVMEAPDGSRSVVGTVRIHESAPGVWHGSRLAVAQHARRIGSVGSGLIRLAVCTAHAHGCHTFLAQVQSQNAPLFRRLHWQTLAEIEVHGLPHHQMQADLAFYPPISDGEQGFLTGQREERAA
ncbi:histone acetyltransferase [Herbaspirillum sp. AP02]|uniref:MSMEG_0567/Sll0786 family nitrogen starvation N-acetyltransferase n=1 Tax=unclassified Herbaspirillum TaxID=2624150 RepID=UPI0015DA375D|nr:MULTISPECIES: MSMEG_0567/Sll0786 family nitrogen starvation N-acetyltransferase [unclassified Herbaspirillum]MBG7620040.1 histone acetyltransferase [Herbaspirillum sp. AP02]NZD69292.1 histone acetyltransferase [Herbaspirillum sp. AP21]